MLQLGGVMLEIESQAPIIIPPLIPLLIFIILITVSKACLRLAHSRPSFLHGFCHVQWRKVVELTIQLLHIIPCMQTEGLESDYKRQPEWFSEFRDVYLSIQVL